MDREIKNKTEEFQHGYHRTHPPAGQGNSKGRPLSEYASGQPELRGRPAAPGPDRGF